MSVFYVLFLCAAVSLDALAVGAAYGTRGIHMPIASIGMIGVVTVVCTTLAMFATHLLSARLIDARVATITGASVLVLLGIYRFLLDYLTSQDEVRPQASHQHAKARGLIFSVGSLVIRIMAKPEAADIDRSMHISPIEAVFLGLALVIDNMVATSAANLGHALPVYTPVAMAAMQMAFLSIGFNGSEQLIRHHVRCRLRFVSGSVLVLLGVVRMVF
jgi:putative sporulation protein YtaF